MSGELPDGSAYVLISLPPPEDHWLDESADCPRPILTRELESQVREAIRYAVRGATMQGRDMDFDPDALVLNAVYALCGPVSDECNLDDSAG